MVYTAEPLEYPKDTTLPELFLEVNINNVAPDKPAIIDGLSGATIHTYSSLRASVRRVANYLRGEIKLPHGAVVGILAPNSVRKSLVLHRIIAVTLTCLDLS